MGLVIVNSHSLLWILEKESLFENAKSPFRKKKSHTSKSGGTKESLHCTRWQFRTQRISPWLVKILATAPPVWRIKNVRPLEPCCDWHRLQGVCRKLWDWCKVTGVGHSKWTYHVKQQQQEQEQQQQQQNPETHHNRKRHSLNPRMIKFQMCKQTSKRKWLPLLSKSGGSSISS